MKKKGFTLIELLAVILILGIIALIAIPTVTNIIKESKRGAFKSSVQNLISAVETQCQVEQMEGEKLTTSYSFTNGKVDSELNVKGDLPQSGTITVDSSCNVTVSVNNGDFCATKALDSDSVLVGELKDGECVIDSNAPDGEGDDEDDDNDEEQNDDNYYSELGFACRRARKLHTEECTQTSGYCNEVGYSANGSKGTTTITYGQIGTEGILTSGDAFDCDVNNDGRYDSETERFYYVSDYFNTTSQEFETDKATLIYYSNTAAGLPDNTRAGYTAYDSSGKNNLGPVTAVTNLPTRTQWTNPNLITGTRAIITESGATSTKAGALPTAFDYTNYAARLLTTHEIVESCETEIGTWTNGELDNCIYFIENTNFSSDSSEIYGYWLETASDGYSNRVWILDGGARLVDYYTFATYDENFGTRPVITLLKSKISY